MLRGYKGFDGYSPGVFTIEILCIPLRNYRATILQKWHDWLFSFVIKTHNNIRKDSAFQPYRWKAFLCLKKAAAAHFWTAAAIIFNFWLRRDCFRSAMLKQAYHCSRLIAALTFPFAQRAIGPWPRHEVVPSAVRAAVRMLTMSWMIVFQVSFFIIFVFWS